MPDSMLSFVNGIIAGASIVKGIEMEITGGAGLNGGEDIDLSYDRDGGGNRE